jgi:negative regulator of flagellin synthesis FlgM
MSNIITTLQSLSASAGISGSTSGTGVKTDSTATERASTAKGDQASISTRSDLLASALTKVDGVSDVRLEKVLPLQQAIANGSYHVSANDVAGKIIDSLLS